MAKKGKVSNKCPFDFSLGQLLFELTGTCCYVFVLWPMPHTLVERQALVEEVHHNISACK